MRSFLSISLIAVVLLSACDSSRRPSNANFTAAINQYLAKHGQVCTSIGRQFPMDVARSEQNIPSGIGDKMVALERAGLVHSTDTTAIIHGLLDPLRGPIPPQPVRRYELTGEGQKYNQQVTGTFGQTNGLCYGQKAVDSIVKWTEPQGSQSQAEVTYRYRIVNLAAWANRTDVQQAFPDIKATINGVSTANQVVGMQLTSNGWEIPGL